MKLRNLIFGAIVSACMILTATSCQENNGYVIDGVLYGGNNFEGEIIYLEPLVGASDKTKDSIAIHDSRFHFDGTIEQDAAYILRYKSKMMRVFNEEPIIILEPGHINVRLELDRNGNNVSKTKVRVKGTPQNDSLQSWREFKFEVDSAIVSLNKQIKKSTDADEKAELREQQDKLKNSLSMRNRESIRANSNAFGDFLGMFVR